MNTGIKNKLKTPIGEQVGVSYGDYGITVSYSPKEKYTNKILRIEEEDCVVVEQGDYEIYLSIDHINNLNIKRT